MKKVYKAHILYTKERSRFEVLENGYVAVEDGRGSHAKIVNAARFGNLSVATLQEFIKKQ